MAIDSVTSPTMGLSPALAILLDSDGPKTAPGTDTGVLGLAELALIESLASGSAPAPERIDEIVEATGADRTRLDGFLEALRANGLLAPGPARASEPHVVPLGEAAPLEPGETIVVMAPVAVHVGPTGFAFLDHHGRAILTLAAREFAALAVLVRHMTIADAFGRQASEAGRWALDQSEHDQLLRQAEAAGLARRVPEGGGAAVESRRAREWRRSLENNMRVRAEVDRSLAAYLPTRPATASNGLDRVDIVGVHSAGASPPLAIGMVIAYAREFEGGKLQDRFDFFPRWVMAKGHVPTFTSSPGVFLFSNYLWSTPLNLKLSDEVKAHSPGSLVIHGGPDTPKYLADSEHYFAAHPAVDVTVRGEGEATFAALLEALIDVEFGQDGPPDLAPLREVAGLSFRLGDEIVHTEDRERIVDLDQIPSPYLTGIVEPYAAAQGQMVIIETNRGCPYGCTFCDWGSATLSRIRKFDLDRVFAELEWCAQNKVSRVFLADANFGILERDIEIAEKVAALKATYGYPKEFATNYAKNTVKHLQRIVEVVAEAGIVTEGVLSLQTMDKDTLSTVKRSNIKTEKYDELAKQFRAADLPLYIDLMQGLPGATVDGFRDDLQQCIDREVNARIFETTLLVNSPMNDPAYRTENRIETEVHGEFKQKLVVSTSSFTRQDFDTMSKLREIYIICENHGLLRQVSRFVRQEIGMREVDLYETLWRTSTSARGQWPSIAFMFETAPSAMVPPVSWRLFIDEVHELLVGEIGVADDAPFRDVLDVQFALLPTRNRAFPMVLELSHDFAAWHAQMLAAKDDGHLLDWPDVVPRLRDLPPACFPVDDPNEVCERNIGYHVEGDIFSDWELRSPVSRSMPGTHLVS